MIAVLLLSPIFVALLLVTVLLLVSRFFPLFPRIGLLPHRTFRPLSRLIDLPGLFHTPRGKVK